MPTALLDSLPDRQRAALEFFEGEGYVLTASRTYAEGLVLVVADDDGAEVEIDELGCFFSANGDRFEEAAGGGGV